VHVIGGDDRAPVVLDAANAELRCDFLRCLATPVGYGDDLTALHLLEAGEHPAYRVVPRSDDPDPDFVCHSKLPPGLVGGNYRRNRQPAEQLAFRNAPGSKADSLDAVGGVCSQELQKCGLTADTRSEPERSDRPEYDS